MPSRPFSNPNPKTLAPAPGFVVFRNLMISAQKIPGTAPLGVQAILSQNARLSPSGSGFCSGLAALSLFCSPSVTSHDSGLLLFRPEGEVGPLPRDICRRRLEPCVSTVTKAAQILGVAQHSCPRRAGDRKRARRCSSSRRPPVLALLLRSLPELFKMTVFWNPPPEWACWRSMRRWQAEGWRSTNSPGPALVCSIGFFPPAS